MNFNENELKNEKWLPLKSNPAYEISNLGRLRHTFKNGNTKFVKASSNGKKNDYLFYKINGIKYYVHQLVLHYFKGKKTDGYECDHINNNRQDNRLCNLRYLTIGENRSHKGEEHPLRKLNNEKVKLIRLLWSQNRDEITNQKKLSELFDITPAAISAIITRRTWKHI